MLILYNFMLFVLYFIFVFCCVSVFFSFFKEFIIMLYIVFYYCWRMYYCNYLLCGENPCKLLLFVSHPIVIIFSNNICLIYNDYGFLWLHEIVYNRTNKVCHTFFWGWYHITIWPFIVDKYSYNSNIGLFLEHLK